MEIIQINAKGGIKGARLEVVIYDTTGDATKAVQWANKLIKDGAVPLVVLDDLLEDLGIRSTAQDSIRNSLSADENALMEQLINLGEQTVDQLCKALEKPPSHINGLLTVLEMKGAVRTSMGKIFVAK